MTDDVAIEVSLADKIDNERANLRTPFEETILSANCKFFQSPNNCQIVDGPVAKEMTCDWVQYAYEVGEKERTLNTGEDAQAFLWELLKNKPQHSELKDIALTPEGWLLLFRDKVGNYWSENLEDFLKEAVYKNHWSQELVDGIIRAGKEIKIKPPTSKEEASKQFGDGDIDRFELERFLKDND